MQPRQTAALLIGLAAFGCAALAPPPGTLARSDALLWRATSPDAGSGAIVLLGSIHASPEPLVLGPSLEDLWRASERLVVEVDLEGIEPEQAARALLRHARLREGRLRDVVAPGTAGALAAFAEARGLDPALFDRHKPWFAAMSVEEILVGEAGLDPAYGVDLMLLARARREGRPVEALESLDEQYASFDALPPSTQEIYLRGVLHPETVDQLAAFAALWRTGDADRLARFIFADTRPEMSPFYEQVFLVRNARMAQRLGAFARDGVSRFAVVGAGHLVGAGSILQKLGESGWHVQRVR